MRYSLQTMTDWHITQIGSGKVGQEGGKICLILPPTPGDHYHDAQISDYADRQDFRWQPPVRMSITAWVEIRDFQADAEGGNGISSAPCKPTATTSASALHGTAGFGFWNHPFVPGERGFRLPAAAWFFFSSPPSDMRLALGVAGPGWKAATIDVAPPAFFALAPTAPVGVLLMRVPALYRRLWPIGQRAIGVSEKMLDSALLFERHDYTLEWRQNGMIFMVDGAVVHETPNSPRGPLGFIAWIDNQYAVVTPQGKFGFGLVDVPHAQTLMIENVEVSAL